MKINALLTILLMSLAVSGCGPKVSSKEVPDVEKAAESDRLSLKSYESSIIDKLYAQELKKRPDLKMLEDDIRAYNDKEPDSLQKLKTYLNISSSYYASAKQLAGAISDSSMKKQLLVIIKESETRYNKLIAADTAQLARLANAHIILQNQQRALRLLITLPVIQSYQKSSKPDTKPLNKLLMEHDSLIEQSKKLGAAVK